MTDRGDAGLGLLFTLLAAFIVPVALLSERIQDTTGEAVLYVTAIGLAVGVFRTFRKYVGRPIQQIVHNTAAIPELAKRLEDVEARQDRLESLVAAE